MPSQIELIPMPTAPANTTRNGYKVAIVALLALVVVLIGVIAQLQRGSSQADPGTKDNSSEPAAVIDTSAAKSAEQLEQERFFLEDLPRRQEGDPLAMGRTDAKVVLTEWADYRCPFCSVFAEETLPYLQPLIDDGTLRVEFRDLAIFGDESIKAATAARAAGVQGKFFEFAHELYVALPNDGHPDIPDELVLGIVADLGLDVDQFQQDWADPVHAEAVEADSQEAQGFGLSSTPSFVVGSQFLSGAQPLEYFQQLIEQQAALQG